MRNVILIIILTFLFQFGYTNNTDYLDSSYKICERLRNENAPDFIYKAHEVYKDAISKRNKGFKQKIENLFGIYFTNNQKFDSAFIYFSKALKSAIENKDKTQIINSNINIGIVLRCQKNYKKSEYYFKEAILLSEEIKDTALIIKATYNLSGLYLDWAKFKEAMLCNRKNIYLSTQINDKKNQIKSIQALGSNFLELNQIDSAKYFLMLAYNKADSSNFYDEKNFLCNNIGDLYLKLKDYNSAEFFLIESKNIAIKMNYKNSLVDVYYNLIDLYLKKSDLQSAVFYLMKRDSIKTIIYDESTLKITSEMAEKYETAKKELQLKQANADLNFQEQKNKQQKIVISLGTVAITLILFFLVLAFINFKKAKKANRIINNQNQVLELQKKEVQYQKEIIEEKQHEIISSITYAQRIQSAVLTGEDIWNKISKEHFIVFQPRDIVSGDFYWAHVLPNGRAVFALADCTGHGVPGGFMSMLGNSFLNELVVENKLFKANEILNRLREKVISALFQKGQTQQKDGMDMALCVWNKMDNTLEFAGANNALYLVRDGELIEYKGDKMPIGTYLEENKPFTSQVIALKTNDMIYLTTDGFADQFGGEKGKKFKYKQLENLLIEIATSESQKQKDTLIETFKQWKSNYEQTDDMSVIGIKVV